MKLENIDRLKSDSAYLSVFENLLSMTIDDLKRMYTKSRTDLQSSLIEIDKMIKHARLNGWKEIESIWNIIGFVTIASLDLKTHLELLLTTKEQVQRVAIIRMIFLQIYEMADDLNAMTGKPLLESINNINANEITPSLQNVRKQLSVFKKLYDKELYSIRLRIGAHREQDFLDFYDTLLSVDYSAAIQLTLKFEELILKFGEITKNIMNKGVEYIQKKYKK